MPRTTAGTRARAGRGIFAPRRPGPDRRPQPRTEPPAAPEPGLGGLSHVDRRGKARMVDVSAKPDTVREARARITLRLRPATLRAIQRGEVAKGDVLGVARLAGIMAAKRTPELIPLCHPLQLTGIDVRFTLDRGRSAVHVETAVRTVGKTGVEMEALTAAAGAGLAIYDMVKAIDRGMRLTDLCLLEKSGGRSGHWVRR
jgi:cyclic pyranopterin monophosphate synthase